MAPSSSTSSSICSSLRPRSGKKQLLFLSFICLILQGATFFTSFLSIQRTIFGESILPSLAGTLPVDDNAAASTSVLPPPSSSSSRRALEAPANTPPVPDNSWWLNPEFSKRKPSVCETPETLQLFLNHYANKTRFSAAQPICPTAAFHPIHVLIPFHNLEASTIDKAIQSALHQDYPEEKVTVWVYDDGSADPTVLSKVCGEQGTIHPFSPLKEVITNEQAQKHTQTQFTPPRSQDNRLLCFQSTNRLGPAGSKFWALRLVQTTSKPNEVVVVVDGDDQLLHNQAFQVINQKYLEQSAWFTYGSYQGKWSEQMLDLPYAVRRKPETFAPRTDVWRYGHPRTFKSHLIERLAPQDFQYKDGSWLLKGTECGMVFRLLELSGPKRIGHIKTKIYQYNYNENSSTVATVDPEIQEVHKDHSKHGMVPSPKPLQLPIHVVILVWKRSYLLQDQLTWLQEQQNLHGRSIHVHLVNNNLPNRTKIESIVDQWKTKKDKYRGTSLAMPITIQHMDEGPELHHNFARFVYVQQLRQTTPLDEVVFLDDDQYWEPTFIGALVGSHKPRGMTTWYGKTFHYYKRRGTVALYWGPDQRMEDIVFGLHWPQVKYYKYGGGGGAVYDASLWLLDAQLQRLATDLKGWAKVDDLWASYVLDALLGWEIRRMHPAFMPIDIGGYQEMDFYREAMSKRLSLPMQEYFNQTFMGSKKPALMAAATYLDPGVNKQEMFHQLQTEFLWDGFTGDNGQSEILGKRKKKPKAPTSELMRQMKEQADGFRAQGTLRGSQQATEEPMTMPPQNQFRGTTIAPQLDAETDATENKASDAMKQMRMQAEMFRSTWNRNREIEAKMLG